MTDKIQLYIAAVTQLRKYGNVGLIILTDETQSKQVSILSGFAELNSFKAYFQKKSIPKDSLVSVLWKVISLNTSVPYEVYLEDIKKGKYVAFLQSEDMMERYPLDSVGAMVLASIADLPIYMRSELYARQSATFNPEQDRMSLPINALDIIVLEHALHKAIDNEDYKMASVIKKEMDNRKK